MFFIYEGIQHETNRHRNQGNSADRQKAKYADGDGLTLLVTAKGAKLWRLRYDRPNMPFRVQNDLTLGKYPLVTLKNARELRDNAKNYCLKVSTPPPTANRRNSKP